MQFVEERRAVWVTSFLLLAVTGGVEHEVVLPGHATLTRQL
jgi:hypothetical protein